MKTNAIIDEDARQLNAIAQGKTWKEIEEEWKKMHEPCPRCGKYDTEHDNTLCPWVWIDGSHWYSERSG